MDAAATLAESLPWLPRIRALSYPAAFAAQDGAEDLPIPWNEFDALFVAGSTRWKLGPAARNLVAETKAGAGAAVSVPPTSPVSQVAGLTARGWAG
jgi:hypothetical protein